MPTVNGVGDIIPDAQFTRKERKRLTVLGSFHYPSDEEIIFHMSPIDFKDWLYLQNPKEALQMCSTEGISSRVVEQLHPKFGKRMRDWWWRFVH